VFFEIFEDADVGKAEGSAALEHEADLGVLGGSGLGLRQGGNRCVEEE